MAAGLALQAIDVSELALLGDHGLSVTSELTMSIGQDPVDVPFSATSAWKASEPEPSITLPPRITTSNIGWVSRSREHGTPRDAAQKARREASVQKP